MSSVTDQTDPRLTPSHTTEDRFSHDVAQFYCCTCYESRSSAEIMSDQCGNFVGLVRKSAEILSDRCGNIVGPVRKYCRTSAEIMSDQCGNIIGPVWKYCRPSAEIMK